MEASLLRRGGGISPYQAAVEGGYEGSEEEFNQLLANIPSADKQTAWDGKAEGTDLTVHTEDGDIHVSAAEKQIWNSKADAATTLAGYGITDGITKAAADSSYATKSHNHTANEVGAIAASDKGIAGGVASLGSDGKVPSEQLPETSVDAYTKEETLTDATAALYGLGTDAVPNDVLAWIAKYNEYWWALTHGEAYSYVKYNEILTDTSTGDATDRVYESSATAYKNTIYVYISKNISISDGGVISLASPVTKTASSGSNAISSIQSIVTYINNNKPCYISFNNSTFYYIPSTATCSTSYRAYYEATVSIGSDDDDDDGYSYWIRLDCNANVRAQMVSTTAQTIYVDAGETTYEHSTDRNAYPDNGTTDNVVYQYLGVPFSNMPRIIENGVKVKQGSYIGTSEATKSLEIGFTPKLFLLFGDGTSYGCAAISASAGLAFYNGSIYAIGASNNYAPQFNEWGSTITIYGTGNPNRLFNNSGSAYTYVAVG